MRKAAVTGAFGLLGSEMVRLLCSEGFDVYGIDNDMRGKMLGSEGSTADIGKSLENEFKSNFKNYNIDIRDTNAVNRFFTSNGKFDLVVHCAAQCSHEYSTNHALEDFALNANATVNMLEVYRHNSPEAVFIHVSSSKVYGDSVNKLPFVETDTRYDLEPKHPYYNGVDEKFGRLDGELHSLFGASKACGDIMAGEYGTYFDLPINIFRPVCISGSRHKGTELHGYLAYLVKCVATGKKYTINGYKGKQVRDNIHARDLANAFYTVYKNKERIKPGEAYNIGGGRESNNSILEAIAQAETLLGKKANVEYSETHRRGDWIWGIFSSEKFKYRFPEWKLEYDNDKLMEEICSIYK